MTIFYTKESASMLTTEQAEKALKDITDEYDLEMPLYKCWEKVWPILDELTETILYLEDRITAIKVGDNARAALATRWSKE